MDTFTPPQRQMIQTWTEARDTLLRENGVLSIDLEEKRKLVTQAGLDLIDIQTQLAESRGRLLELQALEDRHKDSVSIEVSELVARKSRLEAEVLEKENRNTELDALHGKKTEAIETLGTAHDRMKDQASIMDSVVGEFIETVRLSNSDTKEAMADVKAITATIMDRADENLSQTKIILEKLPRYIFELQRPIPVRRTYPNGHPRAPIMPETST
jgi:hypothetical protein